MMKTAKHVFRAKQGVGGKQMTLVADGIFGSPHLDKAVCLYFNILQWLFDKKIWISDRWGEYLYINDWSRPI